MADLIMGGNDPTRQWATDWVNREHRREQQSYKISHRRSERSTLNYELNRINSLKQNRAGIDERYVARVASIQSRKENVAQAIQKRHKSVAGRLQALTPKGRAAQAREFERLEGRAKQLEWRAGRNHQHHLERHDGQVMRARYHAANVVKRERADNLELRRDYHRHNVENKPNQIHERMREIKQEKVVRLRADLKHNFQQQANQPPSQTVQNNPMRENLKRAFREQANQPPSQTIQRKR